MSRRHTDEALTRCPCGGRYEARLVEVRMTVEDHRVVLADVQQDACPVCGSRVYEARTLRLVEDVLWSGL